MNTDYTQMVENEIRRLEELGWSELKNKEKGLITSCDPQEISFPSELFEDLENGYDSVFNRHRSKEVIEIIKKNEIELLWEIGAGDGQISQNLMEQDINIIAIEPLLSGVSKLNSLSIKTFPGTLKMLQLPDNSIEAIGIFDVLEHIDNTVPFLEEIYRVLKPQGYLIITVPAGQYLFSNYDLSIGHFRRYSKTELKRSLGNSGFKPKVVKYQFFILILPVLLLRRIPYLLKIDKGEDLKVHQKNRSHKKILNYFKPILTIVLDLESKSKLPLGFSLTALFVKDTKKVSS